MTEEGAKSRKAATMILSDSPRRVETRLICARCAVKSDDFAPCHPPDADTFAAFWMSPNNASAFVELKPNRSVPSLSLPHSCDATNQGTRGK